MFDLSVLYIVTFHKKQLWIILNLYPVILCFLCLFRYLSLPKIGLSLFPFGAYSILRLGINIGFHAFIDVFLSSF